MTKLRALVPDRPGTEAAIRGVYAGIRARWAMGVSSGERGRHRLQLGRCMICVREGIEKRYSAPDEDGLSVGMCWSCGPAFETLLEEGKKEFSVLGPTYGEGLIRAMLEIARKRYLVTGTVDTPVVERADETSGSR